MTLAWTGWLTVPKLALASVSADWERCERWFVEQPNDREAAHCFFLAARNERSGENAALQLRHLLLTYPRNPGLLLYLAILNPPPADAELCLRSASGYFRQRGDSEGEALARNNLANRLMDQDRLDEAEQEIERERACIRGIPTPLRARYLAKESVSRARHLMKRGDFTAASLQLDEVPENRRDEGWLIMASNLHIETGQLARGFEECSRLAAPAFTTFARAAGLYCEARVLLERMAELPSEVAPGVAEKTAREALALAELENRNVAASAHWMLATLSRDAKTARAELQSCLDVALVNAESNPCRSALSRIDAASGKMPLVKLDAGAAAAADDPVVRAQYLGTRMRISWATRPLPDFLRDAESDLTEIERLRSLQSGAATQVGLFSTWSDDYSWFAGRLLQAAGRGCNSCLGLAFAVGERVRARALLDSLSSLQPGAAEGVSGPGRLALLDQAMAAMRERRGDARLPPSERAFAAADLATLAAKEAELRKRQAAPAAPVAAPDAGGASLAEVQRLLGADEAMLSFQIAPWRDWTGDFGGGAWVLVVTRRGASFQPLPGMGREDLRREADDLAAQRHDSRPAPAPRIYRQLLAPAVAGLPRGIRRLIVVPDDDLCTLPLAALGAVRGGAPLVAGYQISVVPSATLWARWRRAPPPPAWRRPALVLADPPPPTAAVQRTFQAAGIELPTAPLPAARREAGDLVRYLGWGCERRVGGEVSEAAITSADGGALRRFALLHFAAHSIADALDSRRSGIWLSPGGGRDGFLREADIVKLRLDDRLVVLASCSSNRGPVMRGEGVMSLARAFFVARARTVVASLWPQDDADARAVLSRFYRHLGDGRSVAAALRAAQLDRLRSQAHLPMDAWAGFVVLGDGDLVPFPGGRHGWPAWIAPTPAGIATGALALTALLALAAFSGRSAWRRGLRGRAAGERGTGAGRPARRGSWRR